jgi:glycosidase
MPESSSAPGRPIIYQALPRLFGNTNETRRIGGTIEENGCGKFSDFNELSLQALKDFGATDLWLTGIPEQASPTAYPHRAPDPADILKGSAGSPYAIRDCFDVCPDYADDPDQRLKEFEALVARCRSHDMRVFIDFVPNHVARSYASDVRPDLSFGLHDRTDVFFDRNNNFYYVQAGQAEGGPPLRLPTEGEQGCHGRFDLEQDFVRVTGNNAITFAPVEKDWYETAKLNYGHDFTTGRDTSHLPGIGAAVDEVPDTWRKMDEVLAYWQRFGVAGFRVDMAHMIPMEFWRWSVQRARDRDPGVYFFAEAYNNDNAKLTESNVLDALLDAGFSAVYDDPAYDTCLGFYDDFKNGFKWANDLDALILARERFDRSLHYAENHDEVRLASPLEWANLGMQVGRPVSAVLFGAGRGPVMIYSGQEVGEPAAGVDGFGGDNARTTIFDYWCMPEFAKWVNGGKYDGGRLSTEQKELRGWYSRLLHLLREPAFERGDFYGLNHANLYNPAYGRLNGEDVSGHWLYSFLRRDAGSGQAFLVVANFHGQAAMEQVKLIIPEDALAWLGLSSPGSCHLKEATGLGWEMRMDGSSLSLPVLLPCTAAIFALTPGAV